MLSETSDTRIASNRMPSEVSDTSTATDRMSSEASVALTASDRTPSEASDTLTAADKVLSETSDTLTETDKVLSETSDVSTASDRMLSETSDALAVYCADILAWAARFGRYGIRGRDGEFADAPRLRGRRRHRQWVSVPWQGASVRLLRLQSAYRPISVAPREMPATATRPE
ncbi:MAG: hypothetical protein K2M90_07500 [Treponemataceae bacterium]|nr:hypothetical protein [Treponemataceae bacterium]